MTQQEFDDWLDTCPTHKWESLGGSDDFQNISFTICEDEDES